MYNIILEWHRKGKPFFKSPPSDLLTKLVFEPFGVSERGWLLSFDAFLSTAVALGKPSDTRMIRGLLWNTWVLLEDSALFLEPSDINIQALLIIATHGQEIATPSL